MFRGLMSMGLGAAFWSLLLTTLALTDDRRPCENAGTCDADVDGDAELMKVSMLQRRSSRASEEQDLHERKAHLAAELAQVESELVQAQEEILKSNATSGKRVTGCCPGLGCCNEPNKCCPLASDGTTFLSCCDAPGPAPSGPPNGGAPPPPNGGAPPPNGGAPPPNGGAPSPSGGAPPPTGGAPPPSGGGGPPAPIPGPVPWGPPAPVTPAPTTYRAPPGLECVSKPGFFNGYNKCQTEHLGNDAHFCFAGWGWTCAGYQAKGWCTGSAAIEQFRWTLGNEFMNPEMWCCECGGVGVDPMSKKWVIISSGKTCETNDEGTVPYYGAGGYVLQGCKSACENEPGCVAFDFYVSTGWCNLHNTACTTPTRVADDGTAYKMID